MWFINLRPSVGMFGVCGVWAGVHGCARVCTGVCGCAQVCAGVRKGVRGVHSAGGCGQVWLSVHRCVPVGTGVRKWAQVCSSVHWRTQVCVEVSGCLRVCVWDEFSEYLLENRVPTSADFNTYPIRIFLVVIWKILCNIINLWYVNEYKKGCNRALSSHVHGKVF